MLKKMSIMKKILIVLLVITLLNIAYGFNHAMSYMVDFAPIDGAPLEFVPLIKWQYFLEASKTLLQSLGAWFGISILWMVEPLITKWLPKKKEALKNI